jgi:hypothetical protein
VGGDFGIISLFPRSIKNRISGGFMTSQDEKVQRVRSARLKMYKIRDFLRLTETGKIDIGRSKEIIRQLAAAAAFHADHNILLDLRDTTVKEENLSDILEVALEIARYRAAFKGKLANLLPDDEKRLFIARQLKALMELEGFKYEIFTSFEEAVEWLSDITVLT